MFSSMKLGRFFGIDFYVHSTFWILPLMILFSGYASGGIEQALFSVSVVLAAFGCVALHEIGHALAARSYGIRTRDITLYPIGGVASLESMPRNPWQEVVVALAGPAVNLVIAAGLFFGMVAGNIISSDMVAARNLTIPQIFMLELMEINIVLLLFNLIPAFPMDGGRVLRAVLSARLGRLRATEIAAGVATVIAVAFALQGLGIIDVLNQGSSIMLVFLAAVVYFLGQGELMAVRQQEAARLHHQRMWDQAGSADPADGARSAGDAFSGWTWDPVRRVWTEWRDGRRIRDVASV